MDISEEEKARIRDKVEKLKNSRFKQQTLPAWRPIPSFRSTMITFTVFGIIFLALGIILYVMSNQITEVLVQYDNRDECKNTLNAKCYLKFDVKADIAAPVYVYYQLDNFYQNHRRYVKSRSFDQLKGNYLTVDKISSDCDPIVRVKDLGDKIKNLNGDILDGEAPAIPCGLVAKSVFNDRYTLKSADGNNVTISETGIAWESDKEYKFDNVDDAPNSKTYKDVQWLNMTDGNLSKL